MDKHVSIYQLLYAESNLRPSFFFALYLVLSSKSRTAAVTISLPFEQGGSERCRSTHMWISPTVSTRALHSPWGGERALSHTQIFNCSGVSAPDLQLSRGNCICYYSSSYGFQLMTLNLPPVSFTASLRVARTPAEHLHAPVPRTVPRLSTRSAPAAHTWALTMLL